jgi:hemerythrin-like domain-containing protein
MKRHPALAFLSRDHHHTLVMARRLRRATGATGATATVLLRDFREFWVTDEQLHFRAEEELLLPAYAAYGDPRDPAIVRMLVDHVLIRRDAHRLGCAPELDVLHELGARLKGHVALEEHAVFPLIEQALPEHELQALLERLQERCRAQSASSPFL